MPKQTKKPAATTSKKPAARKPTAPSPVAALPPDYVVERHPSGSGWTYRSADEPVTADEMPGPFKTKALARQDALSRERANLADAKPLEDAAATSAYLATLAAPDAAPERDEAEIDLAATLAELCERAKSVEGAAEVAAFASRLADEPLPHADLVKLRDAVNALASALRAAKKDALARQLAIANRGVRRLERASRGARR